MIWVVCCFATYLIYSNIHDPWSIYGIFHKTYILVQQIISVIWSVNVGDIYAITYTIHVCWYLLPKHIETFDAIAIDCTWCKKCVL